MDAEDWLAWRGRQCGGSLQRRREQQASNNRDQGAGRNMRVAADEQDGGGGGGTGGRGKAAWAKPWAMGVGRFGGHRDRRQTPEQRASPSVELGSRPWVGASLGKN